MSKRWSLALASATDHAVGRGVRLARPARRTRRPTARRPPRAALRRAFKVGLVYSKSGPLATYGAQYRQGLTAGIDYATKGTGAVAGHTIADHRAGRRR